MSLDSIYIRNKIKVGSAWKETNSFNFGIYQIPDF